MAKPNVWRADVHLTDRIIVQIAFHRLITGTQDFLSVFLPLWHRLPLYFSAQGDFEGLWEGRMPMLIAHTSAQLIDQLTCPRFPLLAQILIYHPSFNRWFSEETTVYLLTAVLICLIFLFPAPLSTICFQVQSKGETAIFLSATLLVSAIVNANTSCSSIYIREWISGETTNYMLHAIFIITLLYAL